MKKQTKLKLLAISIGLIYVWFGALKFFPSLSPAETLATDTVDAMTFYLLPEGVGYFMLAVLEVAIGLGLMIGIKKRIFIIAALVHMVCTFIPLFAFPESSFTEAPYGFTIVGQYIMKNIVIIVALLIILPPRKEKASTAMKASAKSLEKA
jgi:uncharacterized membrane protein YphA (DoxX/SURF4 family)